MRSAIVTIATGPYKDFIKKFVASAVINVPVKTIYVFTDTPITDFQMGYTQIKHIVIPSFSWPVMPLLRFECVYNYMDQIEEEYIYMLDVDSYFNKRINLNTLNSFGTIGVLHRNIMRYRNEFNYETRENSKAYISKDEGEKYFACGFVGGPKGEFAKMCKTISENIREDIKNGIRAVWGDESHLNRYFIDNRPTTVLPPSYMCPENNEYFSPIITHQYKDFKSIDMTNVKDYSKIDPKDYEINWKYYYEQ